jgi:hypothetical protein
MSGVWTRGRNVRPITLIWQGYRRRELDFACPGTLPRRIARNVYSRRLCCFCRDELSQLTVKRQAVDGPKAGFDNALFVK